MSANDFDRISISETQALQLAKTHFGKTGKIKKLPGDVDFNFYLKTEIGKEFTLKVSRPNTDKNEIDFQSVIMLHMIKKNLPIELPYPIASLNGKYCVEIQDNFGQIRLVRLLHYVPGRILGGVDPCPSSLLYDWGRTCGYFSQCLQDFDHPAAHRSYKWNPSETLLSRENRQYIHDFENLEIADFFWNLFENETLPKLPNLRCSVNHNDAHKENILVNSDLVNPKITGAIDFGDALFTETINELAIACAYAGMDCPDPLAATAELVRGYHEIFPLEEAEVEVLFSLITARLLITASSAAYSKHYEPENTYLQSSDQQAWAVLNTYRKISPAFAHYVFRNACDWEACPQNIVFKEWLKENEENLAEVVKIKDEKAIEFDLSVDSLDLGNNVNFDNFAGFEKTVKRWLEDANATVGIGGYAEIRPVYTTDSYQEIGNNGVRWRTVHLGTDIWHNAGTDVYALTDGIIHSFQDNAIERDYGPTIILEHKISEDFTFHTLYGHLSRASLKGLEKGMLIKKGRKIAEIGPAPENGNWPPHLHFQVLLDLLGNEGNYPGVAFPDEADIWLSICPDFFQKQDYSLSEKIKKDAADILIARRQNLGKSLSISYQKPLHMVRGFKQYLYDTTGRRYLDTCNNVAHVGHQHPRVVQAAQRQIGILNTNTRYLHKNIVRFAEELLATFPPELSVVYFVNSGSEANELALRMAQNWSKQKDMLAVEVGYHGNTGGTIDVSSYKFDGKGGNGAPPQTHILPMPDVYRGKYRGKDAAGSYAHYVNNIVDKVQEEGRNIAGFIGESILSCGGQIVLPKGYLKSIYAKVRAVGGLCIADEVQVGFGRVGSHFWGFELQDVVPDIVTMGKPIGNGHPLAAVVTTTPVAEAFTNGMEYFNTFGGNPVSCAIGREVLQVIKDEKLQANALETGEYLIAGLKNLQAKHEIIGDVRGHGFFSGFELVTNQETLAPAAAQATYFANRMRECGFLMSTDGPLHNVIKIKPPMCFNRENADFLLEWTDKILSEDFMTI
ncbi:MAG: 4-aminobutyrate aminotransferase-like enzyme/Ser/Thr protein kinase RdoA (MazF antagonist) [Saprospiraceae bacterium]|jgi:4-aminobutyrate aminotransferase-like enzyme/Ser/Thr protein kinase RdoA (MazF antagonist)